MSVEAVDIRVTPVSRSPHRGVYVGAAAAGLFGLVALVWGIPTILAEDPSAKQVRLAKETAEKAVSAAIANDRPTFDTLIPLSQRYDPKTATGRTLTPTLYQALMGCQGVAREIEVREASTEHPVVDVIFQQPCVKLPNAVSDDRIRITEDRVNGGNFIGGIKLGR